MISRASSSHRDPLLLHRLVSQALVLIDRADRAFQSNKFYAFSGPDNLVTIRWFDNVPSDHTILGRVLYVTLPFTKKMGKKKTGFLEADED